MIAEQLPPVPRGWVRYPQQDLQRVLRRLDHIETLPSTREAENRRWEQVRTHPNMQQTQARLSRELIGQMSEHAHDILHQEIRAWK